MVSGLEALGVVLALYPMVVDAWKAYKAGKSGAQITQLIQRLETEQIVFDEFVDHLLGSSISKTERVNFNSQSPRQRGERGEVAGCWQNEELQADLKMRLGYSKMRNILDIVANIHVLLDTMRTELPPTRPLLREPSPLSSIQYLRPSKHPLAPLRLNLNVLREYNNDLQRLLGFPSVAAGVGRRKRRLATPRFLRRDFAHALDIYKALCNGYKCACKKPHVANLKLTRLSDLEAEFDRHEDADALELLFSIEDLVDAALSEESAISDTEASPENSDEDSEPSSLGVAVLQESDFWTSAAKDKTDLLSTLHPRDRRTSQISICECPEEQSVAVDDFCKFVRAYGGAIDMAPEVTDAALSILCSERKKYKLLPSRPDGDQPNSPPTISLHDLLNDQMASKRERMRLALELSFAISQYYSTGWINPSWTWRDFSVTRVEGQDAEESQLFVTTKFYSILRLPNTVPATSSPIWTLIGEPILTRLGFALIELAMGKRLSDLRDDSVDNGPMDSDTFDYFTARKILERGVVMEEQGNEYEAVVKACLDHQFYCQTQTRYKPLDSQHPSFPQDVEECIIAPLHSIWVELWGSQSV